MEKEMKTRIDKRQLTLILILTLIIFELSGRMGIITAFAGNEDTSEPTIVSMKINNKDVSLGDKVEIIAEFDDETGVAGASICFKIPTGNYANYTKTSFVKQQDGTYKAELEITSDYMNTTYNVGYVYLSDTVGNYGYVYSYDSVFFCVTGCKEADLSAPTIVSMNINKNEVEIGEEIEITASFDDETGVSKATMCFQESGQYAEYTEVVFAKQSDGNYKAKLTVTNEYVKKKYSIGWILLQDTLGNYNYRYSYTGVYFSVLCNEKEHVLKEQIL